MSRQDGDDARGRESKPRDKLYLIGFSGTGKSHSGWLAARHLHVRFLDMDRLIAKRAGKTIADIFAEDGEYEFRKLERAVLRRVAFEQGSRVISTGGGVPVDSRNREVMKETGYCIRLYAAPETIHGRLGRGRGGDGQPGTRGRSRMNIRPLLSEDAPVKRIADLLAEREDAYAEAADATILTDGREPPEVAEEIVATFRELRAVEDSAGRA